MNSKNEKQSATEFAGRVRLNQQRLSSELRRRFNYIVCGAGTSGCVVAARLAADLDTQVLLLEAGGTDETDLVTNPNRWPMTLGSELDWGFVAEPNPNLNGRAIRYSMGKVLGGGSSINVSTWSRGHRADWDFYASESGDRSWRYEAVLDLYRRRVEAWAGSPDPDYRGADGMVHVQSAAEPHPFSIALLEGAESIGLEHFPNPNGRMMEAADGCAFVDETVREGKRQSIFRSYVYPVMAQPNITVLTGALTTRILFDRRRATGVEFRYQGKTLRAEATREVVLSLGAIHTPKLLMQSGIGDEAELKGADIPVLQALPGVGRNLHDHVAFGCVWEKRPKCCPVYPEVRPHAFGRQVLNSTLPTFTPFARRPRCYPRECSAIQSSSCMLVPSGRHATEKSGRHPPHGVGCSRSSKNRRELPRRSTRPKGSHDRNQHCSRDWELRCFATLHEARDSTWRPQRGGSRAFFSRWAWHVLASVRQRKNGPRCHVRG
jgi:choline dehydrogenase